MKRSRGERILQKRIAQIGSRLQASAVVQEGDSPPEDPSRLLAELDELTAELETLITAINLTNAASRLDSPAGRSQAHSPVATSSRPARACCGRRSKPARGDPGALLAVGDPAHAVDRRRPGAAQAEIDDLARERRELDTEIQEYNWTADLIEDASR